MPGRDGSGPFGEGSLSGRRLGDCENPTQNRYINPNSKRLQHRLGYGFRNNFGKRYHNGSRLDHLENQVKTLFDLCYKKEN